MSNSWIFLTAVRREPYFGGETKLSRIGIPIRRIIFLEEIDGGTRITLDDGSSIDVQEDVAEVSHTIMRAKERHGL